MAYEYLPSSNAVRMYVQFLRLIINKKCKCSHMQELLNTGVNAETPVY